MSKTGKFLRAFLFYFYNHFVTNVPSYALRLFFLKTFLRVKVGKGTAIHMGCFFTGHNISIGNNCVLNRRSYFDGRFGLIIGNNVSISPECYLISLTHDVHASDFAAIGKQLVIDDAVWIGARAILMPGVHLAQGTVVGAGSVVTKSVKEVNNIIGGVPAKFIALRKIKSHDYTLNYFPYFDTDILY